MENHSSADGEPWMFSSSYFTYLWNEKHLYILIKTHWFYPFQFGWTQFQEFSLKVQFIVAIKKLNILPDLILMTAEKKLPE